MQVAAPEIVAILSRSRPSVENLSLRAMLIYEGRWIEVFRAIRSPRLTHLQFDTLTEKVRGRYVDLRVLEEGQREHKWFRGEEGYEHYSFRPLSGFMMGPKASEAGVDPIISRLADA